MTEPQSRRATDQTPVWSDELDQTLQQIDPALKHALELLWRDALRAVNESIRQINRKIRGGMLTIAALVAVVMAWSLFVGVRTLQEPRQLFRTLQTSRFDGAYRSCEATNARNLSASKYTLSLSELNGAAGVLATELLNTLAPLRDGKDGRISCATYAAQQTAVHVPSAFAPPKPPAGFLAPSSSLSPFPGW